MKQYDDMAKKPKAEIDETSIEVYEGTVSPPLAPAKPGRVAVNIVSDQTVQRLSILGLAV